MSDTITMSRKSYDRLWEMFGDTIKENKKICEECKQKNRSIHDNLSYKDIDKYVREDLNIYNQDNPCPISLTILFEEDGHKKFRHYELGPIIGFVVIGYIPKDKEHNVSAMISQVEEDDENWFAPNTPTYMSNAWTKSMLKTLERMNNWCNEHFFEGFVNGKWESKIIKDIILEEAFREDGVSACPVLGGPEE